MKIFVLLSILALPANAGMWNAPDKLDAAVHAFSEAWIIADCLQTFDIKNHGYEESNFVLGKHPSDLKIIGLCGGVIAATTLVWLALPERAPRWMMDGIIIYFEAPVVIRNRVKWGLHFVLPF